jgi:OOP family OmpA-OmpF porin
MKISYGFLAAAALAISFTAPAFAQTAIPPPAADKTPAPDDEPPPEPTGIRAGLSSTWAALTSGHAYAGIGVGAADTTGFNGTLQDVSLSGDAYKLSGKGLLGYQFSRIIGVELQYTDLGSRTVTGTFGNQTASVSTSESQFSVAFTGAIPIGDKFALFGKVGDSRNSMTASNFCLGAIGTSAAYCSQYGGSKNDIMWAIGASYIINPHLSLRLELEDFGKLSGSAGANVSPIAGGGVNPGDIRATNVALDLIFTF